MSSMFINIHVEGKKDPTKIEVGKLANAFVHELESRKMKFRLGNVEHI